MLYVHEILNCKSNEVLTSDDYGESRFLTIRRGMMSDEFLIRVKDSETGNSNEYDLDSFSDKFLIDENSDIYNINNFVFGAYFSSRDTLNIMPQKAEDLSWGESMFKKAKAEYISHKLLLNKYKFYAAPFCKDVVILHFMTISDYSWFKSSNGSITFPKCVSCLGEYCLKDSLFWFMVKNLVIPSRIKYIADDCFSNLDCLQSVKFEGDLEYMGRFVFNTDLTSANFMREIMLPNHIAKMSESSLMTDSMMLGWTRFTVPKSLYEENKGIFDLYKRNFGNIVLVD